MTSELSKGKSACLVCSVMISSRPFCALKCSKCLWTIYWPHLSVKSVFFFSLKLHFLVVKRKSSSKFPNFPQQWKRKRYRGFLCSALRLSHRGLSNTSDVTTPTHNAATHSLQLLSFHTGVERRLHKTRGFKPSMSFYSLLSFAFFTCVFREC